MLPPPPIIIDTIVEFNVANPVFESPNFLNIEVGIRSNIGGILFAKGDIVLEYPDDVLGIDIVQNGNVSSTAAAQFPTPAYNLTLMDHATVDNMVEISMDGHCGQSPNGQTQFNGTPLTTSFQPLLSLRVEIQNMSGLGTLSLDDLQMSGDIFFFDQAAKECVPFSKVLVPNPIEYGDVCSCSFDRTDVSWHNADVIINEGKQPDMFVFKLGTEAPYTGALDTTIVDSIGFYNTHLKKYNVLFFDPSSSVSQRNTIRSQIRADADFMFEYPVFTSDSQAPWMDRKWFLTSDLIHLVFHDPSPDNASVEYLEEKYNMTLYHRPATSLPVGDYSWVHSYLIDKTDCACRNAVDVAREIYEQDGAIIKAVTPAHLPGAEALATSDPYYGTTWHIENTGQCLIRADTNGDGMLEDISGTPDADIDADKAWDLGYTGQGIKVAVLDRSLYGDSHPDISAKYVNGYDFIDNDTDLTTSSGITRGHGQACAGVIAAIANNNEGNVGIAYDADIIPISADFDQMVWAFEHAFNADADVINCSWGYEVMSPDQPTVDQIALCRNLGRGGLGIVIASAAMNENADVDDIFPGVLDEVIGVIASDHDDYRWSTISSTVGSNYGQFFDVAAPGLYVIATDIIGPNGENIEPTPCAGNPPVVDGYTHFFATSCATPVVAGAAAVILSADPGLTATEVQGILQNTADKVQPPFSNYDYTEVAPGKSIQMGYGRINLGEAICSLVTGIEEISTVNDFRVFPNPSSDYAQVTFSLKESGVANMNIYNSLGQNVKNVINNRYVLRHVQQRAIIETQLLPEGIYFITLGVNGLVESTPLIVSK